MVSSRENLNASGRRREEIELSQIRPEREYKNGTDTRRKLIHSIKSKTILNL